MQDDARRDRIDVITAESIDRISRNQEHITAFYKQVSFLGIPLVTVAEGEISELLNGMRRPLLPRPPFLRACPLLPPRSTHWQYGRGWNYGPGIVGSRAASRR